MKNIMKSVTGGYHVETNLAKLSRPSQIVKGQETLASRGAAGEIEGFRPASIIAIVCSYIRRTGEAFFNCIN